jgi:hypothetical protein
MDQRLTEVYGQVQKILKTYELCHGQNYIQKLVEDGPFQSSLGFTLRATLHTNVDGKFVNHRPITSEDELIVGYMFPSYNGQVKLYVNDLMISDINATAGVIYAPVFGLFWYPIRDLNMTTLHFYNFTDGPFHIETEPFYILSLHDERFDNRPTEITNIVNQDKSLMMRFWYPRTDNLTIYSMKGFSYPDHLKEYLKDNPNPKVLNYPYYNIAVLLQRACREYLKRENQKIIKLVFHALPGGTEYEQLNAKHTDQDGKFIIGKIE